MNDQHDGIRQLLQAQNSISGGSAANSGFSPLGHLYSRDATIQGTQNLLPQNVHIVFVFVTSVEGTRLFRGKKSNFFGS